MSAKFLATTASVLCFSQMSQGAVTVTGIFRDQAIISSSLIIDSVILSNESEEPIDSGYQFAYLEASDTQTDAKDFFAVDETEQVEGSARGRVKQSTHATPSGIVTVIMTQAPTHDITGSPAVQISVRQGSQDDQEAVGAAVGLSSEPDSPSLEEEISEEPNLEKTISQLLREREMWSSSLNYDIGGNLSSGITVTSNGLNSDSFGLNAQVAEGAVITPVPEPSSVVLEILGIFGLLLRRSRKS